MFKGDKNVKYYPKNHNSIEFPSNYVIAYLQ